MGKGSFLEDIETIWSDMYERGFVEESDVENLQGNVSKFIRYVMA